MDNAAENLLNSAYEWGDTAYTVNQEMEEHIVIGMNRYITVPEELKRIAVQYDNDIETVTFDCPRFWDEHDLSKMKIYINYICAGRTRGSYIADNIMVDETDNTIFHFTWTISKNVTTLKGTISFLVCAKSVDEDGNEKNHWNSELNQDMYVSEGLETMETILSAYPDVITQLLVRMDEVEALTTPEAMLEYVHQAFDVYPDYVKQYVYDYMIENGHLTEEAVGGYVNNYLDEHPLLLVIGPEKPGVKCVWFNTNRSAEPAENTVVKINADEQDDRVYADVNGTAITEYDFNIE